MARNWPWPTSKLTPSSAATLRSPWPNRFFTFLTTRGSINTHSSNRFPVGLYSSMIARCGLAFQSVGTDKIWGGPSEKHEVKVPNMADSPPLKRVASTDVKGLDHILNGGFSRDRI